MNPLEPNFQLFKSVHNTRVTPHMTYCKNPRCSNNVLTVLMPATKKYRKGRDCWAPKQRYCESCLKRSTRSTRKIAERSGAGF